MSALKTAVMDGGALQTRRYMETMNMINDNRTAKAGKLLCVSKGAYSNYSVVGFFVVLKDFCPADELAKHLNNNLYQRDNYCFEEDSFLSSMLANGVLLEIEYCTMHLTDYSNHEEFRFTQANDG